MSHKDVLLMNDKDTLENLATEISSTFHPDWVSKETAHLLAEVALIFLRNNGWRSPKDCDECEGGL